MQELWLQIFGEMPWYAWLAFFVALSSCFSSYREARYRHVERMAKIRAQHAAASRN